MIQFIKTHYGKLGMSFALLMLIINYFQRQELAELRIKTQVQTESVSSQSGDILKDSLQTELFNAQNMNGRYELSLDHLKEVNPEAAKQFEDFLYKETE